MRKKKLITMLGLTGLLVAAFVIDRQQSRAQSTQTVEIPDQAAYRHLFHQVMAFKKTAEEAERDGKESSHLRTYFKRAGRLSDWQANMLNQVAFECDLDVEQLNARAKILIDSYRAQYPGGQVPQGVALQPPPPELKSMSQERDAIVLRYRDRLHQVFGEDEFKRFDRFVKRRIVINTPQQSANQ